MRVQLSSTADFWLLWYGVRWVVNWMQWQLSTSTKQGSTHNTKEGNGRRIIQNFCVSGPGNTKKSPQMYFNFIFKCLNELFPPYLLHYFIRNRSIHTCKTRQSKDIHLPKPKLTLGKNTFRFSSVVPFNNLPTSVKEASSLFIFQNFLRFHFSH